MNIISLINLSGFWRAFVLGSLLFCWQLPKRNLFWVKFLVSMAVQLAFAWVWEEAFDNFSGQGVLLVCSRYVIHYILAVVMILVCFRCNLSVAVFCATCGYCLQHISNRMNLILRTAFPVLVAWKSLLRNFTMLAVYGVGYYAFKRKNRGNLKSIYINATIQLSITVVALFAMNVVEMAQFLYQEPAKNLIQEISGPIQAVIFSATILMLEYNLLSFESADQERNTLKQIVRAKKDQTEFERKMTDAVNLRAHDLKHKMSRGYLPQSERRDTERVIDEYDTILHTDNEALDVILSQKRRYCVKNNIQLTCIADGKKMDFMSESDIFTLFGNIMDNAIEAVAQFEDEEERIIELTVVSKKQFVSIRCANYLKNPLSFENSLPQTTKSEREGHGYGMKSISLIVEKYGGHYKIFADNGVFVLDILFPM